MNEFESNVIVIFSKDVELHVAVRQENENRSKSMSLNRFLELTNSSFRVYFTDDEDFLSEIETRLDFLVDSIVVEPDSRSDHVVPNDIE